MERSDRERLRDALDFALDAHGEQRRKGGGAPYASHLLQVAGLVLEHGGDAEQAAAALLHDTLEDCERVSSALLRERFGAGVARIVEDCTDTLEDGAAREAGNWRARKEAFLERLVRADDRSVLVSACDKRHNLGAIVGDLRSLGPAALEPLHADGPAQVWYFEGVLRAFGDRLPERLRAELTALLGDLRALVR